MSADSMYDATITQFDYYYGMRRTILNYLLLMSSAKHLRDT